MFILLKKKKWILKYNFNNGFLFDDRCLKAVLKIQEGDKTIDLEISTTKDYLYTTLTLNDIESYCKYEEKFKDDN